MSAIPCASVSLKTMADGTLRISFDIEPKDAQDAFKLFAAPGTPAAIAALAVGYMSKNDGDIDTSPERVQKTAESVHDKPKGGPLSKLAAMWCGDPEFWAWINGMEGMEESTWEITTSDDASSWVRSMCEITSRAELDHDGIAAEKFHRLIRGPYSKYLQARGVI